MAAQVISSAAHDDLIHDAVLDYYGRRLATCSSDKTIKIFEIEGESHRLTHTIKDHDGPVWSLSWAHPKYGTLLASSSYAGQILIHRETAPGSWSIAHSSTSHSASVNLVQWAPHEFGCVLAAASSDGSVSLIELNNTATGNGAFSTIAQFQAHALGANSVSWGPSAAAGAMTAQAATPPQRRFVTGGSDGLVKIWEMQTGGGAPALIKEMGGHTDWVRDVAWSSTVLRKSYIASAGQDKSVRIWTSENGADWNCVALPPFDAIAWRVSWSLSGNVLAVSTGDNRVSLWKEKLAGGWECIKTIEE